VKITKSRIRQLISESIKNTLSEVQIGGKEVEVSDGKITINGEPFVIQANAGYKTGFQFADINLTNVVNTSAGLKVAGTILGVAVDDVVPSSKVAEISNNIESGKSTFEIEGKKATFKFSKVA